MFTAFVLSVIGFFYLDSLNTIITMGTKHIISSRMICYLKKYFVNRFVNNITDNCNFIKIIGELMRKLNNYNISFFYKRQSTIQDYQTGKKELKSLLNFIKKELEQRCSFLDGRKDEFPPS